MSASSRDFATDCMVLGSTTATLLADPDLPPTGAGLYYLVRSIAPNVDSFGQSSSGAAHGAVCPVRDRWLMLRDSPSVTLN